MTDKTAEERHAVLEPMSEADALSEAAMVFADHGIEFCLPWNGDLDDLERERYEALVAACHAYVEALGLVPPTK